MSEYSWLFWLPVIFLFAESWARAWAEYCRPHRPTPPQEPTPPDGV
ncbi:MAG: hypothetical protein PVG79_13475 [Gemmatimonadales bacterium]